MSWWSTTARPTTPRAARVAPARPSWSCRSTSGSAGGGRSASPTPGPPGCQYAMSHGYHVAVQVDGDGQHDPRYLPELLQHLRSDPSLNMVTGSRFIDMGDKDGYRSSASRRIGIRIFSRILSRIVGRPITDPTSGLRMTDRHGIELFARDYPHDYPEVEAIVLSHAHRMVGDEVPVRMRARVTGRSSIGSTQSVYYMIKVTLAVFVGLLRARPAVDAGDAAAVQAEH